MQTDQAKGLPASRSEAARLGHLLYFTGKACVSGHIANRSTKTGDCVECAKHRSRQQAQKIKNLLAQAQAEAKNAAA